MRRRGGTQLPDYGIRSARRGGETQAGLQRSNATRSLQFSAQRLLRRLCALLFCPGLTRLI
jgi:hypothetical protein